MFLSSYSCVLCGLDAEETLQHLFLQCQFAKQCWQIIGIDIPSDADFPEVMFFLWDTLHSQFFMAVIILVCWAIWISQCIHLQWSGTVRCKQQINLLQRIAVADTESAQDLLNRLINGFAHFYSCCSLFDFLCFLNYVRNFLALFGSL